MDRIYLINLFDLYKNLLTEKEKDVFSLYYEDDLSLKEIADDLGVSRSAVHNTIKTVTDKLTNYEDKLGMYKLVYNK